MTVDDAAGGSVPPALEPLAEFGYPVGTPIVGQAPWSDEVGVDGEPRQLVWTVLLVDDLDWQVHHYWDTSDVAAAVHSAIVTAASFVGHVPMFGIVAGTAAHIQDAIVHSIESVAFPAGAT